MNTSKNDSRKISAKLQSNKEEKPKPKTEQPKKIISQSKK